MLSHRRLRLVAFAAVVLIIMIFYYSGESNTIQNQRFYRSTVAALEAHKEAKDAGKAVPAVPAAKPGEGGANAEPDTENNDQMQPAIPKSPGGGDSAGEVEEIPIAGRTKMTVPKNRHEADPGEPKDKPQSTEEHTEAKAELNAILKRAPIIIFSKSYCPFSKRAKSILLDQYSILPAPHVVELDHHALGQQLQSILGENTGRRTVPNVLVSGRSIGGGDEVSALHEKGELAGTLRGLGGKWLQEVRAKDDAGT
ncbi:thioredoxin-like protein [Aspergillus ambiguus]|uniref:glutaredoxin n=1 Tax=Aspergillus ambiguus TaxID=176160 RepID=UPI003CCD8E26